MATSPSSRGSSNCYTCKVQRKMAVFRVDPKRTALEIHGEPMTWIPPRT